ncbi:MAG: dihydroflavonol-4-reductase [Hyphomicrobiaceae bacterium]|jgi:dihydroflavonol-4-reductase
MGKDRVLVTGASGFIAKHCIAELLQTGYTVRGTVRSLGRRDEIEQAVVSAGVAEPRIELVEADLAEDTGWSEAVADCRYVLHIASPFPAHEPRNPDDLIKPARDGALRVMKAAANAGVERMVQTSSIVAIMRCNKPDAVPRTEDDWTNIDTPELSAYARSKTIAERAAWEAIEGLKPGSQLSFCTINPGLVLGPALDKQLSTSHVLIRMIGQGVYPALPKLAFPVVDVRDVARQHVSAMTHINAGGERWLSCNGTLSLREIGQEIAAALPDLKRRVPTIELPSTLARMAAFLDRDLKAIRADLGKANLCDNQKSVTQLGMEFRSSREAVVSAAQSLRDLSII